MNSVNLYLVKKFFITFFITILVLLALGSVVLFGYSYFHRSEERLDKTAVNEATEKIDSNLNKGNFITDIFSSVPKRTCFMIYGLDNEGHSCRTDLMMLGCFNSKTYNLDLISIPRDTHVIMPEDRRLILKENGRWTPSSGPWHMKLNEVYAYAGDELGIEFSVKQIEELLDVNIEYYVAIDMEAFYFLIDEIGGVEFDVPQRMIYDDPEQGLHIDLYPGVQVLNGKEAEGLIRYRKANKGRENESPSYAQADLKRVQVQQEFLKTLLTQLLSKDQIMNNFMPLMRTAYNYLNTNFSIGDVSKYLKYVKSLNMDSIHTYTIPCSAGNIINGVDYVAIDEDASRELLDSIFYDDNEKKEESSKNKSIAVLNGGYTNGMAASHKEMLEGEGFTVEHIGDYNGDRTENARIVVKKQGQGQDLKRFYPGSKIIVDSEMFPEYDIVVILGYKTE